MSEQRPGPSRGQLVAIAFSTVALGAVVVMAFKTLLALFAGVLFALILRAVASWVSRVTRLPYVAVLTDERAHLQPRKVATRAAAAPQAAHR